MKTMLLAGVAVVALAAAAFGLYPLFGGSASTAVAPTDLVVGQAYQVADFRTCQMDDGSEAIEWHFGGADRSRRNQLTPKIDGRGRRIFRVVGDGGRLFLPKGHMRLRRVTEADPTLEGFSYGSYRWEGLVVEYNGRVEPQAVVGPCGPARR